MTPEEQAFRDCIAEWNAKQALDYEPSRLTMLSPEAVAASTETHAVMRRVRPAPFRAPRDRAELGPNMLLTLGQMHVQECVWAEKRFG